MKELREKVAVVTGAASGFGREFAIRCADEGMKVVLTDIDERGLATTVACLKPDAQSLTLRSDVSNADSVERATCSSTMPASGQPGRSGWLRSKTGSGPLEST